MSNFEAFQYFAGLVASGQDHGVAVLDRAGALVAEFEFGEFGWREFQEKLAGYPSLALAAEALQGRLMDQLLMRGYTFFPVTPQNLNALLQRLAYPAEENTLSDARGLAEALRVFGAGWRPLTPQDPLLPEFRRVWGREKDLRTNLVALSARLGGALSRSFPEALTIFNWGGHDGWAFIEKYPLASILRRAKRQEIEEFLRSRDLWETPRREQCLELFAKTRQSRDRQIPSNQVADELREMAKTVSRCAFEWQKLQFLSVGILQMHPDFALFGPPPGELEVKKDEL